MAATKHTLHVALAQLAPVWLDREATLQKMMAAVEAAAKQHAQLIVFGETLLPGYPYWLSLLGGAEWDTTLNKTFHAHYLQQAVTIEKGHLEPLCALAKSHKIAMYVGIAERPLDRGGKSLYASLVYINAEGSIQSVHRKLQPTYDERLTWAPGDGNGLTVHSLGSFTVGGLNCWENWMPLPRAALYGQGEDLHVAVWPGSDHNTRDITRFIARESRSYVLSVSGIMRIQDFPQDTPYYDDLVSVAPKQLSNGGSCIADPDGNWIIEPVLETEGNLYATLDINNVYKERQNFDVAGHYARPDITQLHIDARRQNTVFLKNKE